MFVKILLVSLILLGNPCLSLGSERCQAYVKDVRVEHVRNFGWKFPYHYGVAQLEAESSCRASITARDGGQGIAQFMPKTTKWVLSLMGEKLDPYNPKHAIRMQAFYMYRIHTKENWTSNLWIDYQIYNGGKKYLYQEYQSAKTLNWNLMKLACKRKVENCKINYDYSKKIWNLGKNYKPWWPDLMTFW